MEYQLHFSKLHNASKRSAETCKHPQSSVKNLDDCPCLPPPHPHPHPAEDLLFINAPYRGKTGPSCWDVNRWWSTCFTDIRIAADSRQMLCFVRWPSDPTPCPLESTPQRGVTLAWLRTFHFRTGMHETIFGVAERTFFLDTCLHPAPLIRSHRDCTAGAFTLKRKHLKV